MYGSEIHVGLQKLHHKWNIIITFTRCINTYIVGTHSMSTRYTSLNKEIP